jgi:hypothetical protein
LRHNTTISGWETLRLSLSDLFAAWQNIPHASVMVIQTVEAWKNGIHHDFTDVVIAGVIGIVLLTLCHQKDSQRPRSGRETG